MQQQGQHLRDSRTRLRELEKESATLRGENDALRERVVRSQIALESEEERRAFAQWRRAHQRSAASDAPSLRAASHAPSARAPSQLSRAAVHRAGDRRDDAGCDDRSSVATAVPASRPVRDSSVRPDWVYGVRSPPRALASDRLTPFGGPFA